jgi:soluble lytic murein transglycosylase
MRRLFQVVVLALATSGCATFVARPPTEQARLEELPERRAAFAQAYQWFRHGDLESALPVFTDLMRSYPELADHHLYFAGTINVRLGHDDAAEAAFNSLLGNYPRSIHASSAALQLGTLLVRGGHGELGRSWLQAAAAGVDKHVALAARLGLAEADERSGDVTAAYSAFMAVRQEAPRSQAARAAKDHVLALRRAHPELAPTGSALFEEARLLVAEHDYAGARDAAVQLAEPPVAAQYPTIETADVMRVLAEALYGLGEVARALAVLRRLVDLYPDNAAAPGALFRLASIRWNRDDDTEALQDFEEFHRRYPAHPRAVDALYAIGRIQEHAGRSDMASATYVELARNYPQQPLALEARWRIGWLHYRRNQWATAAAAFANLSSQTSSARWRNEAAYWQARSLRHAGHPASARAVYREIISRDPNGYYAMWAAYRLGAQTGQQMPLVLAAASGSTGGEPSIDPVPAPAPGSAPPGADAFHVQRWQELKAAGVDVLARRELAALEREAGGNSSEEQYLLRAYQTVNGYAAAIRLMYRLGKNAALSPAEQRSLLYPLAFWTIVVREARADRLDPLLVVALMRQESLFDPEARSPADAVGLLQLLPATAQKVAALSRGGSIDPADLTEPDLNIQLGARHLAGLLARFHGDAIKAVAAYNGGETAVLKWENRFADLDPDEFVESISYRETRDYVKKVVFNYGTYRQLYRAADRVATQEAPR